MKFDTKSAFQTISIKLHKQPKQANKQANKQKEHIRLVIARTFYIRRDNKKVDSIEAGRIVIAPLLS